VTLRPSRAAGVDAVAVLGTFLLLGVVCGVLWWLLADPAAFTKTADGVEMSEVELIRRFDVDGWYAVIAAVAGMGYIFIATAFFGALWLASAWLFRRASPEPAAAGAAP